MKLQRKNMSIALIGIAHAHLKNHKPENQSFFRIPAYIVKLEYKLMLL